MGKYIDVDKVNAEIERLYDGEAPKHDQQCDFDDGYFTGIGAISQFIDSLQQEQQIGEEYAIEIGKHTHTIRVGSQSDIDSLIRQEKQEQPDNMIQWTGKNLKEVIEFTGKSKKFDEWFKSWEEYENYVHTHNDILKLFCEDGSHYEVPVGAWIVKTPDGYNLPSVAKYVQQEQPEVELKEEIEKGWEELEKDYSPSALDKSYIIVSGLVGEKQFSRIARHFYELGLNARKEENK